MSGTPEIFVAHRDPIEPVTAVRATLLRSSLATLKAIGLLERYQAAAPVALQQTLSQAAPLAWLPFETALAHYEACETLRLDERRLMAMGASVGDMSYGLSLSTLARTAYGAALTPWLLLARYDTLWSRLFRGGSVQLTRLGTNDVRIELCAARLGQLQHFRTALCGATRVGAKYVGVYSAYVRVAEWIPEEDRLVLRAAWR